MFVTKFRRHTLAAMALPLIFGLAACKKDGAPSAEATSATALPTVAAPAEKAWGDVLAPTPDGGVLMGNAEAPIKVIEYGSLTCSHCAEFAEKSAAKMRDTYVASGRVSFEMRNFVRDPIDLTSAMLVRCGPLESYFPLSEQLFSNQAKMFEKMQGAGEAAFQSAVSKPDAQRYIALGELSGLIEFVGARGLSRDQANTCLANAQVAQDLATRTQKASEEFQINATPTFFINGTKFSGSTWEDVEARLQAMGAR